jgi:hypothetical protein
MARPSSVRTVRATRAAPALVLTFLALAGCSNAGSPDSASSGAPIPTGEASQALTPLQMAPESGSQPSLWAIPKVTGFKNVKAGTKIPVRLQTAGDELRGSTAKVFVESLGFDGWSVRRQIATWTVDGSFKDIEIDPQTFALRPLGSASEVRVSVEYLNPDDDHEGYVTRIPSTPFCIAYSKDGTEAYIGRQSDVVAVEIASQRSKDGVAVDLAKITSELSAAAAPGETRRRLLTTIEHGLDDLAGVVSTEAGVSYPIASAPREAIAGSPESRGERSNGRPMMTLPKSWIGTLDAPISPEGTPPPAEKIVFFAFSTTSFRDSDHGEKGLPGPNATTVGFPSRGLAPMTYVVANAYDYQGSSIDWSKPYARWLNSAGALSAPIHDARKVFAFPYSIVLDDRVQANATQSATFNTSLSGPDASVLQLVDVTSVDYTTTDPVRVTMTRETALTRASAVVGTLFTTPSLTSTKRLTISVGQGCSGQGLDATDPATGKLVPAEACLTPAGVVNFGQNVVLGADGKRYLADNDTTVEKYVVAHELGHALEKSLNGGAAGNYHYDAGTWDGQLCGCNHVAGANKVHCLQSSGSHASAYVEGFGHFVATAVMNSDTQKSAVFTYYKELLVPSRPGSATLFTSVRPPLRIRAGTPVAWLRNKCANGVQIDRATEYDWSTFLWGIHQRETTGSIDYPTWMAVVRKGWCNDQACTGSGTLSWAPVRQAALQRFGSPSDVRMQRMDDLGRDSAVDH